MHAICAAIMFFLAWQVWLRRNRIALYSGHHRRAAHHHRPCSSTSMSLMIGLTGVVARLQDVRCRGAARTNQVTT